MLVLALLIVLEDGNPIIFKQQRIGRNKRPFTLWKFRSMRNHQGGSLITLGDRDPRVTRIGHYLRKWKLDELPQIFNILRGEMSWVGPRPEVKKYVDLFPKDFDEVLKVRPGITDWASIKYRHEAEILAQKEQPETYYVEVILPDKLELGKQYVQKNNLWIDLQLVWKTAKSIWQ